MNATKFREVSNTNRINPFKLLFLRGIVYGYVAPILLHAESKNKRIRAGSLAVLAKHASNDPERWFKRGLKDPAACVRMEGARLLPLLDRIEHRPLFDIARHDPNPAVKRSAKKRH